MSAQLPSERTACIIAANQFGWPDATARRFTTGIAFFVYEVTSGTDQAVVRIGAPQQAEVLKQGLALMAQLKRLGVPLPEILSHGEYQGFPYLCMNRLPGADLGQVLQVLSTEQLRHIAESVADAQTATARLGLGAGFGYAPMGTKAPHACWADVIHAHIERSRQRIEASGLFPATFAERASSMQAKFASQLGIIKPTPFLHDTTTKNVIVSPEGLLSGIVDVDDLCYGDPRYPAALTAASLLNSGGPIQYVTSWLARAGLSWDRLFEFYIATLLLDFMSEHGTSFNGNEVASRTPNREKLVRLFEETASRAEAGI